MGFEYFSSPGSDKKIRPSQSLSSLFKLCDANVDTLDGFFYPRLTLIMDPYKHFRYFVNFFKNNDNDHGTV